MTMNMELAPLQLYARRYESVDLYRIAELDLFAKIQ